MEDAHLITKLEKNIGFIGVFDGHGGELVSKYCAQEFPNFIKSSNHYNVSFQDNLIDTYLKIDTELQTTRGIEQLAKIKKTDFYDNQMLVNGKCNIASDIGSTALTVVITENKLFVGNVGDCRSVLVKGDETIQLTVDHRPNLKSEVERIVSSGGFIRNGRVNGNLSLTRAIGDFQFKEGKNIDKYVISPLPDVFVYDLDGNEDFFIIACDGVWDVLSNDDVVKLVKDGLNNEIPLNQICEKILTLCLAEKPYESPGTDNMTIVVAVFEKSKKWGKCCAGGDMIS